MKKLIESRTSVIEYYIEGEGIPIVFLPSKGRGQKDFDYITEKITKQGFKAIRPEYRGVNRSKGINNENIRLEDLANDVAYVLDEEKINSALIVGHAFGNWIARILAKERPDLVKAVCVLAAASKGKFLPEISEALAKSSDLSIPDNERVNYIKKAFFAPESDASVWLDGWFTEAKDLHTIATKNSNQDDWWDAGGKVPFLEIRSEFDPFAPSERAGEMRQAFGNRVLTVEIPDASHSLLPEKPEAVVSCLVTYGKLLFSE